MTVYTDFKPGQVIVVQGDSHSWIDRGIAFKSSWWWTHTFIVTSPTTAVEANFPKVREFNLQERLEAYRQDGRSLAVFEWPNLTDDQRSKIATQARTYIGRWYDIIDIVWYSIFNTFSRTSNSRWFFCSRLVTASYRQGANIDLVAKSTLPFLYFRDTAMRDGYVTPAELANYISFTKLGESTGTGQILSTNS